jgi:hypothetical protein
MAFHAPIMAQPQTTAAGNSIQSHFFMRKSSSLQGIFRFSNYNIASVQGQSEIDRPGRLAFVAAIFSGAKRCSRGREKIGP